jgi:hypothetical protein
LEYWSYGSRFERGPAGTICGTRFGMRLREANVRENTIADILWHEHSSMTGHYSVAQIDELVAALELIADEPGRANKTLQMLQLEAKEQVVAGAKSPKSP